MRTRRVKTTLAAVAVAGLLGACGSDGSDNGDAGSGTGTGSAAEDATLAYARCMRDNGVEDFPDPGVGEDGGLRLSTGDATDPDFEDAEHECRPILDEAQQAGTQLSPEEEAAQRDRALALARCMRDRGWDFPDPEVEEGGGIAVQNPEDVGGPGDPRFERFDEDMTACHEEAGIPTPEGGGELDSLTGDREAGVGGEGAGGDEGAGGEA
ncbi:MAG TPA: hypothetical protein VIL48_02035 [Acidimicrobiales bacterium]